MVACAFAFGEASGRHCKLQAAKVIHRMHRNMEADRRRALAVTQQTHPRPSQQQNGRGTKEGPIFGAKSPAD